MMRREIFLVSVLTLLVLTAVSCANPYGSSPPTTDTVTLLPTAGPLAEAAYSSASGGGSPVGPVLTLVNRNWEKDGWKTVEDYMRQIYTFPHLEARNAADVRMLVCIRETREEIGYYGGLGQVFRDFGYRVTWDIRLVLWPSGDVLKGGRLVGGDPPETKYGGGSACGPRPTDGLRELLAPAILADKTVLQVGSSISSVVFSPDGKTLASGSADDTIRLWDPANGQELRALTGHADDVSSLAFSPDGKVLASGSADDTIRLWNPANGQELRALTGHADDVSSLAFSPDGKVLASGSADDTIRLWDPANGQETRTITGSFDDVSGLAFSPDGKILASSHWYKVILWDVGSGQRLRTLNGHSNYVSCVAFSPDGKILASGSHDNTIKLWGVSNWHRLRTLTGHLDTMSSVAFSPDSKMLASSGSWYQVNLWDVDNGQELRTLTGHLDYVSSVAFSPDGKILASGSADDTVKLWGTDDVVEAIAPADGANSD